jgi:hypothetical protein
MSAPTHTRANNCGCCAGIGVQTPTVIYNRPALLKVAYRVGNYTSFRQSLLAHLSDGRWPVLRQLHTRDDDDFTVALLDAWAVAGDVLTFYQERIANESYLRTAAERLSILELACLLGYQLAPGLAASSHLAFTMEETPGAPELSPKPVQLATGTRVQSVPGPDEQPQTFETIEAIEARVDWNAILPQLSEPQTLAWDIDEIWVDGVNLSLNPGDSLLIHAANAAGGFDGSLRRVTKVQPDADAKRTHLALEEISNEAQPVETTQPGVWVMRTLASPFGHNAPKEAIYDGGVLDSFSEWSLDGETPGKITLSSRNEKILDDSWIVIEQDDPDEEKSVRLWIFSEVTRVTHLSVAKYGIAGGATRLELSRPWKRNDDSKLSLLRGMTIAAQSEELTVSERPLLDPLYGSELASNSLVDGLVVGRPLAITGKRQRVRIRKQANNPTLFLDDGDQVVLETDDILMLAKNPVEVADGKLVALTSSEFTAAVNGNEPTELRLSVIDRDGRPGTVDLRADAIQLEPAGDDDDLVHEIAFIDDVPDTSITCDRDRTTLRFARPIANVYDRSTALINANVAAATHGESVKELLGSGDATIPHQIFTLRQPPLTYVSADTPGGRASTLKVYVNDVLWREAPFLYGRGANERIYILRQVDDGRTTVQFGDGINGARLPTGQNNVRAEYRKGTGLGGLVETGQLRQLLSRPLGLKEVVNPEDARGAEEPESRDDARTNAPTAVLTLDRAVSLQDYEDFSRTFAGIAKAQAVWVWDGRKRTVFITVAGVHGEVLEEDGSVIAKLKEALREYGDPFVVLTLKNFRKVLFQAHGTVTVAVDHDIDKVITAVRAALAEQYSFENRAFGQPVALSEVVAIIQSIPGVVAVDIDQFYRNDTPTPAWKARLDADCPAMGADGAVAAAELLLVDESTLKQLGATQ